MILFNLSFGIAIIKFVLSSLKSGKNSIPYGVFILSFFLWEANNLILDYDEQNLAEKGTLNNADIKRLTGIKLMILLLIVALVILILTIETNLLPIQ